jgi:hypothetical protein
VLVHKEGNPLHRVYLLRCWQEGKPEAGEKRQWRFSLEEVLHKGLRQGFDSLEAMVDFVRNELDNDGDETRKNKG